MADCSCDFCKFDVKCPYAYVESDCEIVTIKNAKKLATVEFITFYEKLKNINEDLYDDYLGQVIWAMSQIISNSKKDIPEFILKEI